MPASALKIKSLPKLNHARMIMGFDGWMDGGDVSTGTVEMLRSAVDAYEVAEIGSDEFYMFQVPGSMETAAALRPHVEIRDGVIGSYDWPRNVFHCDLKSNLILFEGREPNLRWEDFSDCVFALAGQVGVKSIYFVGSVSSVVPHTREPRIFTSMSSARMKHRMEQYGIKLSDYEGPASFVTHMLAQADSRGFEMATLVAEIPAYVQGTNPKSIETVIRKLAALLDLGVNIEELRALSDNWERRINETIREHEELGKHIEKLEQDYDNEVFDTQMGDLKDWLEQKGIRLD